LIEYVNFEPSQHAEYTRAKRCSYRQGLLDGGVTDVLVLDNYLHDDDVINGNGRYIAVCDIGDHRIQIRDNRCIMQPDSTYIAIAGIGVYNSTHVEISGNYIESIAATASAHGDLLVWNW
jgi:hypothetical protein